jgi:hypothetical protein
MPAADDFADGALLAERVEQAIENVKQARAIVDAFDDCADVGAKLQEALESLRSLRNGRRQPGS